jgi:hypothetical protein
MGGIFATEQLLSREVMVRNEGQENLRFGDK